MAKCRSKGRCKFRDKVSPSETYIYYVSAANQLGESEAAEFTCDVPAPLGLATPGGACTASGGGSDADDMDVLTAVQLCVMCFLIGGACAALFMFQSEWVLKQMKSKQDRGGVRPHWVQKLIRMAPVTCVVIVYLMWFGPLGVAPPMYARLLPTLNEHVTKANRCCSCLPPLSLPSLCAGLLRVCIIHYQYPHRTPPGRCRRFVGGLQHIDLNADGEVSLVEMQSKAMVPIVADSPADFRDSKLKWIKTINSMQLAVRADTESVIDGDPVMQLQVGSG